jgi:CheY-like chemotaxis protein
VVDDNEDLALSSSKLLRLLGHEVTVAFDGRQALEVARDFRPDVALVDVGLPHIDGYELARLLRAEYGPGVLLIIITAYAQDNPRRQTYEAYFDHHFTKPLDYMTIADLLA